MWARPRLWTPAPMQPTFNMRSLWHLAGWRVSASLALALTAAATFSETGSRRLLLAFGGADAGVQSEQVSVRSRDPDPAAVMAPLVESVRTLTAERDRLAVRISNIERHLDDLTGSIKAQLAASPPGAARTLPQPSPESVGAPGAGSAPQATAPASPDASRPGIGTSRQSIGSPSRHAQRSRAAL